eukprot:TRINITY_DN6840_c0_g2_i1.p1 TRINITY_DN6840_c0_g2~~TRINITY_DN6840_c0_g2_i1.p1  ORF type:complete len:199 (+),score=31.02 TRINITY_DN6840_c0_g2_i1:631-1227(+)
MRHWRKTANFIYSLFRALGDGEGTALVFVRDYTKFGDILDAFLDTKRFRSHSLITCHTAENGVLRTELCIRLSVTAQFYGQEHCHDAPIFTTIPSALPQQPLALYVKLLEWFGKPGTTIAALSDRLGTAVLAASYVGLSAFSVEPSAESMSFAKERLEKFDATAKSCPYDDGSGYVSCANILQVLADHSCAKKGEQND